MDRDAIELRVTLPGTIDDVWRLLVEPQHIRAWFGDHVKLEARLDGLFHETWWDGARQVATTGRVVSLHPPSEIAWTWADEDWPCQTRLTLRLEANEAGTTTTLRLTHSGWSQLTAESGQSLVAAHERGWERHLRSLKTYAELVGPSRSSSVKD